MPNLFVFGEYLDLPSFQALAQSPQHAPYLELLKLFAFSSYSQYRLAKAANPLSLPDLTPDMITKMRFLSIAAFGQGKRTISYDALMSELEIDSIRELEDVLIDAFYLNVIKGCLCQDERTVEIDHTMPRDVRAEDVVQMDAVLTDWLVNCDQILANIQHQMDTANKVKRDAKVQEKIQQATLEQKIASIKKSTTTTKTSDPNQTDDSMVNDYANNREGSQEKNLAKRKSASGKEVKHHKLSLGSRSVRKGNPDN